jgi:protein phosphatase
MATSGPAIAPRLIRHDSGDILTPFSPSPLSVSRQQELDLGRVYGMTDIGLTRESNQDNFLVAPELGLLMVADGMGGHDAGEVASSAAIEAVRHFIHAAAPGHAGEALANGDGDATVPHFHARAFDPVQADPDATWTDATMRAMITLHDALEFANQRLYQDNAARGQSDGGGMGTTLTGLWQVAPDGPLFVFHVGDSRLYCYRRGQLTQLTRDQTLYQQALDAGQAEPLPPRNLLLQALGPAPDVQPELQTRAAAPGDIYLLCSDGLYGATEDAAIAAVLAETTPDKLADSCARLIEMAKRDGGRDNITAVLLYCRD